MECQASTPCQKLEAPESCSTLYQLCIMLASRPSLCCSCRKKPVSWAEKQRVWSRSCGVHDLLRTIEWLCPRSLRLLRGYCSTLYQLCIMTVTDASRPSLCCSCRKKPVSCREAEGLVTQLWCPRFVTYNRVIVSKIWITGYWLRSQLWHVTDANQETLVEIELLATVAWKWGCQPFSCPCLKNVTHCPKEIFSTYLPFVKSKSPLPTKSLRSPRAAAHSTSSALCLHHAHPFVAAEETNQSHAEKQMVWSRSCRLQDLLRTIEWLCPRFGLQAMDCALSCDMWLMQTNEPLSRLSF